MVFLMEHTTKKNADFRGTPMTLTTVQAENLASGTIWQSNIAMEHGVYMTAYAYSSVGCPYR